MILITDFVYRNYSENPSDYIDPWDDFTEKKIRCNFLTAAGEARGILPLLDYYISYPTSKIPPFTSSQVIAFGLVKKDWYSFKAVNLEEPNADDISIAIVNPGYGYNRDNYKNYKGNTVQFDSKTKASIGIRDAAEDISKSGSILKLTNWNGSFNTTINSFDYRSNDFYNRSNLSYCPYPSLPIYFPPPLKYQIDHFVVETDGSVNMSVFSNTSSNMGYLIPPRGFEYRKNEQDNWVRITDTDGVKIHLKDVPYQYSVNGQNLYEDLSEEGAELPNFPITGGMGEESRLVWKIDFSKIDLPEQTKEALKTARLSWYLRLIGSKEDVYIYSGENFKRVKKGSVYYSVLPNNSNISEGATIYKNYKDVSYCSLLTDVENNFAGFNISSVKAAAENEENDDDIVVTLNNSINIPHSKYVTGDTPIMEGMKCLINGLEYEVSQFNYPANSDGEISPVIKIHINKTSSGGETVDPAAIQENMRVEIYRDKCIAYLENQSFKLQEYEAYTIWSNSILTQQYYFETNEGQVALIGCLSKSTGSFLIDERDGNIYDSCNLTFVGSYSGEVLWHKWELYESIDNGVTFNLVKDSGEIYSTDLTVEYKGLNNHQNNRIYKIKLIVSNNLSQVVEREEYFYIDLTGISPITIDGNVDCEKTAISLDLFPFKTLSEDDHTINLSEFIVYKKNITIEENEKEMIISKEANTLYDYALANHNDYYYKVRAIYEVWLDDSFTGKYTYRDGEIIIFSSTDLTEEEIEAELFNGEVPDYNFYKYFWNKLLILETQKRLSEDTVNGQYYISTEPNSKWDFQLEIEDADITINTDSGVFDGLYEFPRVNETYRNYKSQPISCKLGKIDNSTKWRYGRSSVDIVNKWKKFCNDGHIKILRDRYGNLVPVKITAKSYKCNNTKPMIMDLSFDWVQIGSENGIFGIEISTDAIENNENLWEGLEFITIEAENDTIETSYGDRVTLNVYGVFRDSLNNRITKQLTYDNEGKTGYEVVITSNPQSDHNYYLDSNGEIICPGLGNNSCIVSAVVIPEEGTTFSDSVTIITPKEVI